MTQKQIAYIDGKILAALLATTPEGSKVSLTVRWTEAGIKGQCSITRKITGLNVDHTARTIELIGDQS